MGTSFGSATPGARSVSSVELTDLDHRLHPISAPYTLVEYGDFECPDCAEGYHVVKELLRDLGDDLCYVFRHFPKDELHPIARFAAEASEAADMQAKFWLMHDRLFQQQNELSPTRIRELAREISLDLRRFDQDLENGEPRRLVESSRAEGARLGVRSTPTFFINGRRHEGPTEYDPLAAALTRGRRKTT